MKKTTLLLAAGITALAAFAAFAAPPPYVMAPDQSAANEAKISMNDGTNTAKAPTNTILAAAATSPPTVLSENNAKAEALKTAETMTADTGQGKKLDTVSGAHKAVAKKTNASSPPAMVKTFLRYIGGVAGSGWTIKAHGGGMGGINYTFTAIGGQLGMKLAT